MTTPLAAALHELCDGLEALGSREPGIGRELEPFIRAARDHLADATRPIAGVASNGATHAETP